MGQHDGNYAVLIPGRRRRVSHHRRARACSPACTAASCRSRRRRPPTSTPSRASTTRRARAGATTDLSADVIGFLQRLLEPQGLVHAAERLHRGAGGRRSTTAARSTCGASRRRSAASCRVTKRSCALPFAVAYTLTRSRVPAARSTRSLPAGARDGRRRAAVPAAAPAVGVGRRQVAALGGRRDRRATAASRAT